MQLNEFFSKANSKNGREITFMVILIIGGTLSFLVGVWIMTYTPPSNWKNAVPSMSDVKSMNITTSTFSVTREWRITFFPSNPGPREYTPISCAVEIYNASTDVMLRELNLTTVDDMVRENVEITGSFYLKIQVHKSLWYGGSWAIRVEEYDPPPPFHLWVAGILLIGVAAGLAYLGYKTYRTLST